MKNPFAKLCSMQLLIGTILFNSQSIFIKASPEEFIIENPGGFPPGITLENILHKTSWRNRMIAETSVGRGGQSIFSLINIMLKKGRLEHIPDLQAYLVIK